MIGRNINKGRMATQSDNLVGNNITILGKDHSVVKDNLRDKRKWGDQVPNNDNATITKASSSISITKTGQSQPDKLPITDLKKKSQNPSFFIPNKSYSDNRFTLLGTLPPNNPKPILPSTFKQVFSTPSSSQTKPISLLPIDYVYKSYEEFICVLEPEFFHTNKTMNHIQFAQSLLSSSHNYLPDNYNKSQSFYEEILVQTNSATFHYTMENSKPRYCKVKLLKALTISDWGQEPNRPKDLLLQPNVSQKFNYWDYIVAWKRSFFLQNNNFSLSYFLYFSEDFIFPTPFWFHKWWANFGIDQKTIPSSVLQAYDNFMTNILLPEEYQNSPSWLVFCRNFQIPWILMTEFYVKDDLIDNVKMHNLVRRFKTKWWAKTNILRCDSSAVTNFFKEYPQFCKKTLASQVSSKEQFLAKKQQLLQQIARCHNDDEMQDLLQLLSASGSGASNSDKDPFNQDDLILSSKKRKMI